MSKLTIAEGIAARKRMKHFGDVVLAECRRASEKHPPMNSFHEAYAVIAEELDEFWEIVRQKSSERNPDNARTELLQIAAMAIRAAVDLNVDVSA